MAAATSGFRPRASAAAQKISRTAETHLLRGRAHGPVTQDGDEGSGGEGFPVYVSHGLHRRIQEEVPTLKRRIQVAARSRE